MIAGEGVSAFASVFAFAFLVVIPSAASEPAFSRSSFVRPQKFMQELNEHDLCMTHAIHAGTGKKREEAGSLAALGMTTRKAKAKAKAKVKVKATAKANQSQAKQRQTLTAPSPLHAVLNLESKT